MADLDDLKAFFNSLAENEAILNDFVRSCDDVLATLPDSHQTSLRTTLKGLEARWYDITNYRAPQHLINFEFELTEVRR